MTCKSPADFNSFAVTSHSTFNDLNMSCNSSANTIVASKLSMVY
uniref:Uncharacterized protein n=1 Tax=viral metagenome TaxID=1070528 RepID=A0A6C0CAE3_9ZZZZ